MRQQDDVGATVHLDIDALDAVTILHDADGEIAAVNQEAVDQLGYPRAHLRAMTVDELLVETGDWPPEASAHNDARGQSIRHHDGTILDGTVTLRPLEAPEPYLLQFRFEDISDPARSPRRVAQYQTILDELEYAVYATDADWQIEYVNPAFEDLFGYSATEAIGQDVEALLASGEHEDSFYADLRSTIEAGHRWDGEVINETGAGDTTRVHVTILPVEVADTRSFIALAEDVTGAHSTQRLQQERRTLQMLNQAMQHDIETDLERVQEAIDHLRNRGLVADTEQFTQLTTAASDVLRTVDQARSTMRAVIERESPLRPLRVAPTIRQAATSVESGFREARIVLDRPLADVQVMADELLRSLFRNVMVNGIEHNDAVTPQLRVSTRHTEGTVTVRITDNGPGIPTDVRRTVTRGEVDPTDEAVGLGLYLIRTLIDRYNGAITLHDAEPRGSVVELTFPTVATA